MVIAMPIPTRAASTSALIEYCSGQVIGVPRIHSWSLVKAIRLPLKLMLPIRQLSRMVTESMTVRLWWATVMPW